MRDSNFDGSLPDKVDHLGIVSLSKDQGIGVKSLNNTELSKCLFFFIAECSEHRHCVDGSHNFAQLTTSHLFQGLLIE